MSSFVVVGFFGVQFFGLCFGLVFCFGFFCLVAGLWCVWLWLTSNVGIAGCAYGLC